MTIATDPTFIERKGDGWHEFAETYDLNFKEVSGMSYDLMYQALKTKRLMQQLPILQMAAWWLII